MQIHANSPHVTPSFPTAAPHTTRRVSDIMQADSKVQPQAAQPIETGSPTAWARRVAHAVGEGAALVWATVLHFWAWLGKWMATASGAEPHAAEPYSRGGNCGLQAEAVPVKLRCAAAETGPKELTPTLEPRAQGPRAGRLLAHNKRIRAAAPVLTAAVPPVERPTKRPRLMAAQTVPPVHATGLARKARSLSAPQLTASQVPGAPGNTRDAELVATLRSTLSGLRDQEASWLAQHAQLKTEADAARVDAERSKQVVVRLRATHKQLQEVCADLQRACERQDGEQNAQLCKTQRLRQEYKLALGEANQRYEAAQQEVQRLQADLAALPGSRGKLHRKTRSAEVRDVSLFEATGEGHDGAVTSSRPKKPKRPGAAAAAEATYLLDEGN